MYTGHSYRFNIDIEVRDTDGDDVIANRLRSALWRLIYSDDKSILEEVDSQDLT